MGLLIEHFDIFYWLIKQPTVVYMLSGFVSNEKWKNSVTVRM